MALREREARRLIEAPHQAGARPTGLLSCPPPSQASRPCTVSYEASNNQKLSRCLGLAEAVRARGPGTGSKLHVAALAATKWQRGGSGSPGLDRGQRTRDRAL